MRRSSFTVTTADDALGKRLEPGAPVPSRRFAAMKALSELGILTGVTMMPILPFIEDNEENIRQIVTLAHENGASYILPAFGVTLRDRQREFYYKKLDRHFPGLRSRYEKAFGERYSAHALNRSKLGSLFWELCSGHGIPDKMPVFLPQKRIRASANQPSLF